MNREDGFEFGRHGKRRHKLFLFPHAGSSCAHYWGWKKFLDPDIETVPMELPGRGSLMDLPLCGNMGEVIEILFARLAAEIGGAPYSIFGHSMGGLLAYELAHRIQASGLERPRRVFVSGRRAPHLSGPGKLLKSLSQGRLQETVMAMGGTAAEVFNQPQFAEIFLPILEADVRLIASHVYPADREPLDIPLSIFCGQDDEIPFEALQAWRAHTRREYSLRLFAGGHFYLKTGAEGICSAILETLGRDSGRGAE